MRTIWEVNEKHLEICSKPHGAHGPECVTYCTQRLKALNYIINRFKPCRIAELRNSFWIFKSGRPLPEPREPHCLFAGWLAVCGPSFGRGGCFQPDHKVVTAWSDRHSVQILPVHLWHWSDTHRPSRGHGDMPREQSRWWPWRCLRRGVRSLCLTSGKMYGTPGAAQIVMSEGSVRIIVRDQTFQCLRTSSVATEAARPGKLEGWHKNLASEDRRSTCSMTRPMASLKQI